MSRLRAEKVEKMRDYLEQIQKKQELEERLGKARESIFFELWQQPFSP